jgi:hypothetical protein
MTGTKTLAELVDAARALEASIPTSGEQVRKEVRSAGYAVRSHAHDGGVYAFVDPAGRGKVGMLVEREHVITYAEWQGRVYPMWPTDDVLAHEQAVRDLLWRIRAELDEL